MALRFFGRLSAAHHGVKPVEAQVPEVRLHGCREDELALGVKRRLLRAVGGRDKVALPRVNAGDLGAVVIALQEFRRDGHRFFFHRHHDAVRARQRLAAVIKQPLLPIARLPFAGVERRAVERVSLQHVLAVRARRDKAIGPRSHGPRRERHAVRLQKRVRRIERLRLPRHRGKKRHGEPVQEGGIAPGDRDFQRAVVQRLHAFQGVAPQVGRRRARSLRRLDVAPQRVVQFFKPRQIRGQNGQRRTHDAGIGDPLDAIDIVFGRELARSGVGKIQRIAKRSSDVIRQPVVAPAARLVPRKRGMRRISNAGLQHKAIASEGDGVPRGRRTTVSREVLRRRHRFRGLRNDFVGTLQVVVAQKGLIDGIGVERLVARVGDLRIQRLGASS